MKKILLVATAVLAFAMVVTSCGTTAEAAKAEPVHDDGSGVVAEIVDWDGRDLGIGKNEPPEWVVKARNAKYSEISLLKDKVPFYTANYYGEDLELTFNDADVQASAEFAKRAIRVVVAEAEQTVSGDRNVLESVKIISEKSAGFESEASFNGLEQIATYWTRERMENGRLRYHVFVLYGMNINDYERNISQWFESLSEETDTAALDSIKKSVRAAAKKQGFASAE